MSKGKCTNDNHKFTNGKHDPICSAVEMADHISKVRLIITCFNDHLEGTYNIYVNHQFELYLSGYSSKEFIVASKKMLKELKGLVKYRHIYLLCNDNIVDYKRVMTLISTYYTILSNIKSFTKDEIELILSDLVNSILEYYDIELIKDESSSNSETDDSIILSDSVEEFSLDSDDQSYSE